MSSFSIPTSREHELRMLAELVRLSRVTLLFAEANSDKGEVVRSTVLPFLQAGPSGARRKVVVLLDWWEKLPLSVLNARIDEALARSFGSAGYAMGDAPTDSLCTRLAARQQAFDCTFIIIFDRFEEYLTAAAQRPDIHEFEAQFVEAVNSLTLRANFLLSLDADAAPLLAPLRELIPGLGDARVTLPKLDAERAPRTAADSEILPGGPRLVGSPRIVGERDARLASAGEPVGPFRGAALERHDKPTAGSTGETPGQAGARTAETRSRSVWMHLPLALAIVLAVFGLVLVLAPRQAGEPAPGATIVSPTTTPAQSDAISAREQQAQTGESAAPAGEKAVASHPPPEEEPMVSDPRAADEKAVASHPPPEEKPVVSDPRAADEKAVASDAPPSQARTPEESAAAAASGPPLLYIHVRSEAQRTYAADLVEPLARHGIRVSGIRIVSVGPPVSDLRYFRRADRAEALRINGALDEVGRPAERLRYIAGFEEPVPRRHYEFWLPPPF